MFVSVIPRRTFLEGFRVSEIFDLVIAMLTLKMKGARLVNTRSIEKTKLSGVTLAIFFCLFIFVPLEAKASNCMSGPLKGRFFDYVVGKGDGDNYMRAKEHALSELGTQLGGQITISSLTIETLHDVKSDNTIRSNASIKGTGIEELEECALSDKITRVVMGIKKSRVRDVLRSRAGHRQEILRGPLSAVKISKIRGDHQRDRESWISLGFIEAEYPNLTIAKSPVGPIPVLLKAADDIAARTLHVLANTLSDDGYVVGDEGPKFIWGCQITKGIVIREFRAFEARCVLSGGLLPAVYVKGVAADSNVEDLAVRLILLELAPED
jgi:hypothetical protein